MKVEREKKNLLWKSASSQIPSRTESHHLTASLWLSPSDHTLSATKKKKEDASTHCCFAYENPKSTPLPLYIVLSFWSSTLTNALKWKGLLKKRERRRVELLIMSQYTLMMRCVKDTHCDGLLSVKAICIWHGRKKKKNGGWGGAGWGGRKVSACFF